MAHGCTGKGNDQVRFEVTDPGAGARAEGHRPAAQMGNDPRQLIEFAEALNIPIPATKDQPYSIDGNIWGRAIECGDMEDLWARPPEDVWSLTKVRAGEAQRDHHRLRPGRSGRPRRSGPGVMSAQAIAS